jgi:DNA-binding IclR family transcriptional regulator
MLGTVERAGDVLDLFSIDFPEWGVTEVSAQLGTSKSTAHALLATLAEIGLLERTRSGRYRLGWRILSLGRTVLETSTFRCGAQATMRRLAACHGETVHVAVWERNCTVEVLKTVPEGGVTTPGGRLGPRVPPHVSAAGKVLLAHRPAFELERAVREARVLAVTPRTITDAAALNQELERIRRLGYARDIGEAVAGIASVAAPITGQDGVVAAISISAPADRFERLAHDFTRAIREAADQISREAAGHGGKPARVAALA